MIRHKKTGELRADKEARNALRLNKAATVTPQQYADWEVFIQSTSHNRKCGDGDK